LQRRSEFENGTLRGLLAMLVVGVLALCVTGIITLALNVRNGIDSQATATSDNSQWTLSQLEIEFLNFKEAISAAITERKPLSEVRIRYDIVYSRTNTFLQGKIFSPLRKSDQYNQPLSVVRRFLDSYLSVIDGPDEALRAALPALLRRVDALRPTVRTLSISGLTIFALESDARRKEILDTLIMVGTLTALMIVFLLGLVALLLRFDRLNRSRTREVELSLNRIKATVDTALDAVIVTDRDGQVLEFNPAAERIFGYQRALVLGLQIANLIMPADQRDEQIRAMQALLNASLPEGAEHGRARLTVQRSDKSEFPVEFSITQSEDTRGTIYISFIRDLSAEIAAEQELISARDTALAGEKAKADLLAVMSHEMRTPLNGMLGTLELLQDSPLTPSQQRYLGIVQESGKLLLHHVNDVLDITRLENGQMQVALVPTSISALFQEVISNQSASAKRRQNLLQVQIDPKLPERLNIDAFQVKQILLNLVGNAIKFTQAGRITLCADYVAETQLLSLCVEDTGIGIAAKDLDRVFEEFVVLDASYARMQGGTGLGLAITRRIANGLGGQITAFSREGEGSIFTLQLPDTTPAAEKATRRAVKAAPAPDLPQHPLTILVVEDNAVNRFVVRELLVKQGHLVHEACDGKQGLSLAAAHRFDLILMDISMPLMDGVAATKAIRSGIGQSATVPIIALTAHARGEEVARFIAAGMQEVLIKPISGSTLREVLRRYCAPLRRAEADLDADTLNELFQTLGPEKSHRLLTEFIAQTDGVFADLLATPLSLSAEIMRQQVHKLCGSCAVFGVVSLAQALHGIETLCRADQPEAAQKRLRETLPQWHKIRESLMKAAPAVKVG
jgi:PAS domain S-box-containing protein